MKVAVVVQRYGADINGGAELHARYVAEHLAPHVEVEVLTTCAKDYISWANDYPPGLETVGRIPVRRFPVSHPRSPKDFGAWSARVFESLHSVNDELAWVDAEGPTSPSLVRHLTTHQAEFDFFLFFSFRYYHAFHGARAVPHKAILVPTAERDEALGLAIFPPVLRSVRACMYNSPEERALLEAMAGTDAVPGIVVGIGSDVPENSSAARFRRRTGIEGRTAIYIGRIDENKGCAELFDFWTRYSTISPGGLVLTLIGTPVLEVPSHPRIRHLGFVSDQEKFDALAAAEFLVMPSYFESLSMVALEAWAMGKPVLANGKCDVLKGQAIRSNAGLYYESYPEFVEAVRVIEASSGVASVLGRNGRAYFKTHYSWPVIERKYLDMFARLSSESAADIGARTLALMPGWWTRRQRTLPPAREVLAGLPSGPIRPTQPARVGTMPGRPSTDRRPTGAPGEPRGQRRPDQHRARETRPSGAAAAQKPRGSSPPANPPTDPRRAGRGRGRRGRPHGRPPARKGGDE